jgi:hypothetical protein
MMYERASAVGEKLLEVSLGSHGGTSQDRVAARRWSRLARGSSGDTSVAVEVRTRCPYRTYADPMRSEQAAFAIGTRRQITIEQLSHC